MRVRLQRIFEIALTHPSVTWVLFAGYVAVGVFAIEGKWFLNDEGLLTWTFAAMAGAEPVATLFLLKSRPLVSAAYLLPSAAGIEPFLVVHVLVTGMAILLVGDAARNQAQRWPNLAPAVVAISPLFVSAGPSGISNGDGAVLVAGALALISRGRRPFWTGVVLGASVLARTELVVIAIPLFSYALRAFAPRSSSTRHLVLGAVSLPVAYLLGGAAYHHDPLWVLHFPPTLVTVSPDNAYFRGLDPASWSGAVDALLAVSPAAPVLLLARWRVLARLERASLSALLVFVLALRVLPIFGLFNFDDSPRYLLPLLPLSALVAGRVIGSWGAEGDRSWWSPVALLVLLGATWVVVGERSTAALALVVGLAATLTGVRLGARWIAPLALVAVVAVGLPVWMPAGRMRLEDQGAALPEITRWLGQHGEERPVVTNNKLLEQWTDRVGDGTDVYYIVQPDMLAEMRGISNPHNGQRQALVREMARLPYGTPIFPAALEEGSPGGDPVFVLMDDSRLAGAMDPDWWEPRLRVLEEGRGFRIAERLDVDR